MPEFLLAPPPLFQKVQPAVLGACAHPVAMKLVNKF